MTRIAIPRCYVMFLNIVLLLGEILSSHAYGLLPTSGIVRNDSESIKMKNSSINATSTLYTKEKTKILTRAGFIGGSSTTLSFLILGTMPSTTNAASPVESGLDSLNSRTKSFENAVTTQAKITTKEVNMKTTKVTKQLEKETAKVSKNIRKETKKAKKKIKKEIKKADRAVSKETKKLMKQVDPSGQRTKQVQREAKKVSSAVEQTTNAIMQPSANQSGILVNNMKQSQPPTAGGIDVSKIKKICNDPNTKCVR